MTTPADELRATADALAPEQETRPTLTGEYPDPDACVAWMLRDAAETCDVITRNGLKVKESDPWLASALAVARALRPRLEGTR